jgi:VWFA-related protein
VVRLISMVLAAWLGVGGVLAQEAAGLRDPLAAQLEEEVRVRLVLVDTVVVDRDGRTVGDLARDDFELTVDTRSVEIDTLDVACEAGGMDAPGGVRSPRQREALPGEGRKLVVAVDYQHLGPMQRVDVLEQIRELVEHDAVAGDEVMVAALTGGLRVEQAFTADRRELGESLRRMEYDMSLWQPSFSHTTEEGFFQSMIALFNVLETIEGPKAMVLYSSMQKGGMDSEYEGLATYANSARCPVYTVQAEGLTTPIADQLVLQAGHR